MQEQTQHRVVEGIKAIGIAATVIGLVVGFVGALGICAQLVFAGEFEDIWFHVLAGGLSTGAIGLLISYSCGLVVAKTAATDDCS